MVISGYSLIDDYYQAVSEPNDNDLLYIWQSDTGCGWIFTWNCHDCETTGWNYVEDFCQDQLSINESPNSIFIWPGASPSTNMNIFGENTLDQLPYNDLVFYYKTFSTTNPQYFLNDIYDPIGNGIGIPQFMQMKR